MICVVIPYFQRQPGVLRKALLSVAAQQGCSQRVQILVVDDASPVPAEGELAGIDWPASVTATIIHQPNAGPGGARNTGLDAVPADCDYVAFLDSDDEWSVDHLSRAKAALDVGHDFYFADHLQLGQTVGAFERASRLDMTLHEPLKISASGVHSYSGDFFDQILRGNVVGTSTVVYRWQPFHTERFRVEFTSAGEDYLFWMVFARRNARVVFSTTVEAVYGRGVNVYAGSGWGTEGHLKRLHDEIAYKRAVGRQFQLNSEQTEFIRSELRRLRIAFTRDLAHRLRHRKPIPSGLLQAHAHADALTYFCMPLNIWRIATGH